MRLVLAVTTFIALASAGDSTSAKSLRITVVVPTDTPASATIFVAGSLPRFGNWKPDGWKLQRQADGSYAGDIDLEPGQTLEYKITRGDWSTVEKKSDGSDRPNRTLSADANTKPIAITVESWATANPTENRPTTVVGTLKTHQLDSKSLGAKRVIRVWLPPDYDASSDGRFSVLYMQDGQNCFDRATSAFGNEWEIDETLTRLISEKRLPPLIVVGIDNGLAQRANEFTYDADREHGGGKAANYAKFMLTEVMPFVEKTYRTYSDAPHTYIGGSSLGGLISLEIARRNPNTFSGVIAMSPSLWWADESLTKAIDDDPGGLQKARVWLDIGAREGESKNHYVEAATRLDAVLTRHKIAHHFTVDEVHPAHNEPAWASRFSQAILYILNTEE
jgi:predicted alpha/beta superfamily hydrolase